MQASPQKSPEASVASSDKPAQVAGTGQGREAGLVMLQAVAGMAPRLDSRQLFASGREVVIAHEGADYRLRLTQNGKLILTK